MKKVIKQVRKKRYLSQNLSKLSLPYLKKWTEIHHFVVWIVDGEYIRDNIDEEFTNFGQHYRFKFIPKKEFWIDHERTEGEEQFFIDHLLVEHRLMAKKVSYEIALDKADKIERRERSRDKLLRKITPQNLYRKIHQKQLKEYSQNKIKVWIVNGEIVRDLLNIDFTEGGHDQVYHFILPKEIWLDDDLLPHERKFILLHEAHERALMSRGWNYPRAHFDSSRLEYYYRHHPQGIKKKIMQELKKSK
jgi:GTP-binding protein EngB required for normal cell division